MMRYVKISWHDERTLTILEVTAGKTISSLNEKKKSQIEHFKTHAHGSFFKK